MSRHNSSGSNDHRVQRLGHDYYEISWVVDRYYENSRLRFPAVYGRGTDEAGARRFIKKWGITHRVPEELQDDKETK